jgi:hybrid cluster-associated redox disulfide protein
MSKLEHTVIEQLLQQHPQTLCVFVKHRMLCPGCPAEAFHTVAEAARTHGFALDPLLAELRAAIAAGRKA